MKDVGLLLLRVTYGAILVAHGFPKILGGPRKRPHPLLARGMGPNYPGAVERDGPGFVAALEKRGIPYPELAATASGLAEFGGGLALAAGVLTRPVALATAFNMGVAVSTHWEKGLYGQGGFEFPLLLGATTLARGLTGPGAISIDAIVR